jgi:hypothetical protein
MRAFLPRLRVVGGEWLAVTSPPRRASDAQSCVLLWEAGREKETAEMIGRTKMGTPERLDVVGQPSWPIAPGSGTWFIARLDPKSSVCL